MAHYSERHAYLTVNGELGTPTAIETWTWGLRMRVMMDGSNTGGFLPTQGQMAAWLAAISDATVSYFGTVCGDPARLSYLKLALIEPDGTYVPSVDSAIHEYEPPVDPGPNVPHAWQVALVTTTETGRRRGLAHRGRWYTPLPRYAIAPDGLIPQADAESAAGAAIDWLHAIRAASVESPGAFVFTAIPRVYSPAATSQGPTTSNEITGVSVGRRLDIIRSRGRSQNETREYANL